MATMQTLTLELLLTTNAERLWLASAQNLSGPERLALLVLVEQDLPQMVSRALMEVQGWEHDQSLHRARRAAERDAE